MFDKQYRFRGKHAAFVSDLTQQFDAESKAQLFRRNLDVLINAPLIGFLYGRKAEPDSTKNPNTDNEYLEIRHHGRRCRRRPRVPGSV